GSAASVPPGSGPLLAALAGLHRSSRTMIGVDGVPEPDHFDAEVRQPGEQWLLEHPNASPAQFPSFWNRCRSDLKRGFRNLCGYSAMYVPGNGTVDHYLSRTNHRTLTYRWNNYRFAAGEINTYKGTWDARVLDPYEVKDGWFEILLPSLQ